MATDSPSRPSFTPRRRWTVGFNLAVRTIVVFAVVVMVNYLAGKFFHREYLSAQTRVELSPRTVNLLKSLTNDVKITVYYNREDDLYSSITSLLREYRALNQKLQIEVVDYLRDAADAQRVKLAYGLPETNKDEEKNFIIFDCEGRKKIIPGIVLADRDFIINKEKGTYDRPLRAFRGELLFSSLLVAVTSPKPLLAYVLTGHGEHGFDSGDEVSGYVGFRNVLEQNYIKAVPLTLTGTNPIPQDCNLLIVAGPRSAIPDEELEKIDQYLTEGGRLFALFNSASEQRASLERVLARWNVMVTERVVSDVDHSIKPAQGVDVVVAAFSEHPAVKPLLGFNLDLILPRPIKPIAAPEDNASAPKVQVLFATEASATLVGSAKVPPQSFPLAVAVERAAVPGVVTGRGTTRMIVVGDSFFLGNGHIKVLANRDFVGYAVNWLLERPQLMEGLGPRAVTEYRIALTAEQQWQMQWLLLGALPGGILLFGGLVWLRRRK